MKATLILSTLILLAAWTGCSDNMNVTDPLSTNHYAQNQPNHSTDPSDPELVWSLNELKVWTVSDAVVENKATYVRPPQVPALVPDTRYMISFDITTDADKSANGYMPFVSVSRDSRILYEGSDFNVTGEVTVHKELQFTNSEFSQIQFYIALF